MNSLAHCARERTPLLLHRREWWKRYRKDMPTKSPMRIETQFPPHSIIFHYSVTDGRLPESLSYTRGHGQYEPLSPSQWPELIERVTVVQEGIDRIELNVPWLVGVQVSAQTESSIIKSIVGMDWIFSVTWISSGIIILHLYFISYPMQKRDLL